MKHIIFVAETNYQLMYATILNFYFKKNNCNTMLINFLDNKFVNSNFAKFDSVLHVEKRYKLQNGFTSIIEEFIFLHLNKDKIKKNECDLLIIFKDSNYLQGYLIEYYKKNNRSTKVVLVEEGLSLYRDDIFSEKSINYKLKFIVRRQILKLLKAKNVTHGFGYNKLVDIICAYHPERISHIKKKNKGVLQLPHNAPPDRVFRILNKIFRLCHKIKIGQKKIMFIGQPLSEMKICSEIDEKKFFEVINSIAVNNNFAILIKPHPKENIKKYNNYSNLLIMPDQFVPAELVLNEYKPDLLLTWYSSAGINAKTWWGVETLYLYRLLGIEVKNNGLTDSLIINDYLHLKKIIDKFIEKENSYYQIDQIQLDKNYSELIAHLLR